MSVPERAAHAALIKRIAEVAQGIGDAAGVGASELAGQIVSCLAKKPEIIERFMLDGAEMIISGEIATENGVLTFHRQDGKVTTPDALRVSRQVKSLERTALSGRKA